MIEVSNSLLCPRALRYSNRFSGFTRRPLLYRKALGHSNEFDTSIIYNTSQSILNPLGRPVRRTQVRRIARVAFVTGLDEPEVDSRILGELGVSGYFDLMAGFMTVSRAKPEPDMILYLLDNLGVEPDEAVFIDDTNVGLTAGIRAGVYTVGITTGNNALEQIKSVNPDTIIHMFSDIPRLLE